MDIIKNIEAMNEKKFEENSENLKDLILGLEADSVFNSKEWTQTDVIILNYLKKLNRIYNLNNNLKDTKHKKIASIIGSTPNKLSKSYGYNYSNYYYKKLREFFKQLLYTNEITEVYIGMNDGVEMCVAHAIIELRELGFPIKLNCLIPYEGYDKKIKKDQINIYNNIIRRANKIEYLSKEEISRDKVNEELFSRAESIFVIYNSTKETSEEYIKTKLENKDITCFDINNQEQLTAVYLKE